MGPCKKKMGPCKKMMDTCKKNDGHVFEKDGCVFGKQYPMSIILIRTFQRFKWKIQVVYFARKNFAVTMLSLK
jgi:hypothetical protein